MTKVVTVVAAVLVNPAGQILLTQRPAGKSMAGLWEFPGGKLELNETPEAALCRELSEELGLSVMPHDLQPLTFASHLYETFHLLMPLYLCSQWAGDPASREDQDMAWVAATDLKNYPMPPADEPLIPLLQKLL